MVIVVFAGFFIVFYDSTTSIFPRRECPPIESLISDISNPMRIIAKSHW